MVAPCYIPTGSTWGCPLVERCHVQSGLSGLSHGRGKSPPPPPHSSPAIAHLPILSSYSVLPGPYLLTGPTSLFLRLFREPWGLSHPSLRLIMCSSWGVGRGDGIRPWRKGHLAQPASSLTPAAPQLSVPMAVRRGKRPCYSPTPLSPVSVTVEWFLTSIYWELENTFAPLNIKIALQTIYKLELVKTNKMLPFNNFFFFITKE